MEPPRPPPHFLPPPEVFFRRRPKKKRMHPLQRTGSLSCRIHQTTDPLELAASRRAEARKMGSKQVTQSCVFRREKQRAGPRAHKPGGHAADPLRRGPAWPAQETAQSRSHHPCPPTQISPQVESQSNHTYSRKATILHDEATPIQMQTGARTNSARDVLRSRAEARSSPDRRTG